MAQLYRFTDENGQVRLMAEIDPAPGGVFNGGTITEPLTIDLSAHADNTVALVIFGVPSGNQDLVEVRDGSGGFVVEVFQANGHGGGMGVTSFDNDFPVLYLDHEGNAPAANILTVAPGGSTRSRFDKSGYFMTRLHAAPADGDLVTGELALWFDQTNGAAKQMAKAKQADGTVVSPGLTGRDLATTPAVSAASTLALGTAYQNTLGYDVLLCVYLSVTVNTSGVLKLGVGPTTTPTQQTLVTGITSTGLWPVPIYLPSTYYALLSVTGTITVAVDGQIAMPV